MWPPASIRSSEYIRIGGSASLGRVPPTDGGLVPSQTYKDLVACADNTAVLTDTGSDPERISNHCKVVTKRGRYADGCERRAPIHSQQHFCEIKNKLFF